MNLVRSSAVIAEALQQNSNFQWKLFPAEGAELFREKYLGLDLTNIYFCFKIVFNIYIIQSLVCRIFFKLPILLIMLFLTFCLPHLE